MKTSEKLQKIILTNQTQSLNNLKKVYSDLNDSEKKVVDLILSEISEFGESRTFNELISVDYEYTLPTVTDFITQQDYLGYTFNNPDNTEFGIYDIWIPHLQYALNPVNKIIEVLVTGAIGIGKTVFAVVLLLYHLSKLLLLKEPQTHYGLLPRTTIVLGLYNITLELAGDVAYKYVQDFVRDSPFFQERLIKSRSPDSLNFPKNIEIRIGSSFKHGLGQAIFFFLLDEANFGGGDTTTRDKFFNTKVMRMYTNFLRRMESRFAEVSSGEIPGQLCMLSSKQEKNAVLEQHIANRMGKPYAYIINHSVYDARSFKRGKYTGLWDKGSFKVLVGNRFTPSRILQPNETDIFVPDGCFIEEVPAIYYESFLTDISGSLQDISGIATGGVNKLIPNVALLKSCFRHQNFFCQDEIILDFDNDDLIEDWFYEVQYEQYLETEVHNVSKPRFFHLDFSLSGDRFGIGCSHLSGVKLYTKLNIADESVIKLRLPYITTDFSVGIRPSEGKEIPYNKIESFIKWLRDRFSLVIGFGSADGFQSAYMIQNFKRAGIDSRIVSVDRTDEAYVSTKNCVIEGRVDFPYNLIHYNELYELVHDKIAKKVDHPEMGSKDIADGVTGSIFNTLKFYEKADFDYEDLIEDYNKPTQKEEEDKFKKEFIKQILLT